MSTRVYVPSSARGLRELLLSGGLGPAPFPAHAVTGRLRAALPGADEEECEYVALTAAAQDSLALIGDDEPARRVVVVAEAASVTPAAAGEESLVEVGTVVPLAKVVAVHVDSDDAESAVAAARAAGQPAREGGSPARDAVERCLDHELGWYATQEVHTLVESW